MAETKSKKKKPSRKAIPIGKGLTFELGDYEKAVADYTEALRLNPSNDKYKDYLDEAKKAAKCRIEEFSYGTFA